MRINQHLFSLLLFLSISDVSFAQQQPASKDTIIVNQDSVYSAKDVDVVAEYPGGDIARRAFLERNINALVAVENSAPAGTYTVVIVCFIGIDGKVFATVPETSHGYGMEKEVLRIIKKLPKPYSPAMKKGFPVKTKIRFPVTFSVSIGGNRF